MQTLQADIDALAQQCGVDPTTVEQAARAVCRRLLDWHGDGPMDTSREVVEAALMDYSKAVKRMSVAAHMNPRPFARQVLGEVMAA